MERTPMRVLWGSVLFLTVALIIALVFLDRSPRLMLIQHGTPEVPGGHAFAIMNPFRNRRPEQVAEELISDLHTSRCEQILRGLHSEDPRRRHCRKTRMRHLSGARMGTQSECLSTICQIVNPECGSPRPAMRAALL